MRPSVLDKPASVCAEPRQCGPALPLSWGRLRARRETDTGIFQAQRERGSFPLPEFAPHIPGAPSEAGAAWLVHRRWPVAISNKIPCALPSKQSLYRNPVNTLE
jgi:hypothetical protein